MRILALDVGDRRIGVAVSDPTGLIARPLAIIARKGTPSDTQTIAKLIREQTVEKVVIGLPLSLDGHMGLQAEKVQQFSAQLASITGVSLELYDERFSTITAREHRLESGVGKKKRRAPDDDAAAAVILQSYLDKTRHLDR
jgi:putative Holliday junction resolvase